MTTLYAAVCSECGKDTELSFKPTGTAPVYCKDCYAKKKGRAPAKDGDSGSEKWKCDLCPVKVPYQELRFYRNARGEEVKVCAFCDRVIMCQSKAKIFGLWTVPKHPTEEVQ